MRDDIRPWCRRAQFHGLRGLDDLFCDHCLVPHAPDRRLYREVDKLWEELVVGWWYAESAIPKE